MEDVLPVTDVRIGMQMFEKEEGKKGNGSKVKKIKPWLIDQAVTIGERIFDGKEKERDDGSEVKAIKPFQFYARGEQIFEKEEEKRGEGLEVKKINPIEYMRIGEEIFDEEKKESDNGSKVIEIKPWMIEHVTIGERIFDEEDKNGNGFEGAENPWPVDKVRIGEEIFEGEEESNGGLEVPRRRRRVIGGEDEIVEEDSNLQNGSNTVINVKNYDLPKILEEQETHDLFCPNCKSCITKRVILKKRRKTITDIKSDQSRPYKIPNLENKDNDNNLNEPLLNPNDDDEKELHILFKCLSCFTFFIPTGWIGTKDNKPALLAIQNQHTLIQTYIHLEWNLQNKIQEINSPVIPPKQEEFTIVIDKSPKFKPRNCRLCPAINNWDILKPIVYGGLIEIIASLSVVSSAAATGATTPNIFLLGIANLIGGFVLLLHELMELKRAQDEAGDFNHNEVGRYFSLLGHKGHFGLHATLAIFSYLLFGLLPPVIYGFTFRKSDDSEYKIIAVALSAIFCVAILAIGKAHVRPERKYFKTLFYYVGIAVESSGLAYAGGILVKRLVEKLGLFDGGNNLGAF
ncbi:hypothetical protein LUZ60_007263 [Juncus effusus]|nr:hypothetical protein LUZ60_007263 [Juncus effusus]